VSEFYAVKFQGKLHKEWGEGERESGRERDSETRNKAGSMR